MIEYLVQKSTMVAIADAIRDKINTSELMTPQEMVEKIEAIETGSHILDVEGVGF